MDVLLREIRTRADGRTEYVDTEISTATFVIGAGADSSVQVLGDGVAAQHAEVRGSGAKAVLTALTKAKIPVNGRAVRTHRLAAGDAFDIGGHAFKVFEAPTGFDLGLELVRNAAVPPSAYEAAFRTELSETWLGKRGPAWALLAAVLLICLVLPLAVRYLHVFGHAKPPAWVPGDVQWSTGPLSAAHKLAIGNDCSACHEKPFAKVRDEACRTCHEHLADHFHAGLKVEGAIERCAACHREHNEPATLIVRADSLCTDCHSKEQPAGRNRRLAGVTGFAQDAHPAFAAHLLESVKRTAGTGFAFDWGFTVSTVGKAQERSNLKFPHDVHLNPEKVQSEQTSKPLVCADCHVLAPDKEHFLPVTMERHCSGCHDLKFDETDPERQLPHGQPLEAILAIEGHFLKKYSDPHADRGERDLRRLPDREVREAPCTGSAFECATRRTLAEAINQFTVRGCVTCHSVEDNGSSDVYSRFQVLPIRLNVDYFPAARFDHASHLVQRGKTGDAACLSCHGADKSKKSSDLLIPDIDKCTECHGETVAGNRVALECIECHTYHPGPALQALRDMEPR